MAYMDNPNNSLGVNTNNNQFDSSNVVANPDGTVLERLEQVQKVADPHYNAPNYLAVPITFVTGTTGAVATHEIFTVTGAVRVKILAVCSTNLAGATATIQLGVAGSTDAIVATTTGTDIDAGEIWHDASPDASIEATSSAISDFTIVNGLDVGYEVAVAALSGGVITFHCWYWPLDSTGAVVASDGLGTL